MEKILQHLSKDPKLKELILRIQVPEAQSKGDLYADLIRAIVGQQLSVKAAATIYGRFIELFELFYCTDFRL